ncbi:hypothetical protein K1719_038563 [Acacia pycnantha]|nr:hypothetical protein K1719_038563 [Acacia pycnantha]
MATYGETGVRTEERKSESMKVDEEEEVDYSAVGPLCEKNPESKESNETDGFLEASGSAFIVYAIPDHQHKQMLWSELRKFAFSIVDPWAVIGDFNDIALSTERTGGLSSQSARYTLFSDRMRDCNLIDLGAASLSRNKRSRKYFCIIERKFLANDIKYNVEKKTPPSNAAAASGGEVSRRRCRQQLSALPSPDTHTGSSWPQSDGSTME